jgi:hypothetical protein
LTRGVLPHDVPSARRAGPEEKPDRARHSARHARTSGAVLQRTSLSIRSAERRRWSADLTGPNVTALVVHGVGGIGKSTLVAQIVSRVSRLTPERVITVLTGEVSAASLVAEPAETDLVVLDDFDDNLSDETGWWTVRDPQLAALLAGWTGKLLISCVRPFSVPGLRKERLAFRHLGPLTRSGAAELALSLPALRMLAEAERDLAWRLTAGHPRAMEYLDSLLADGLRLDDVSGRITAAVQARAGQAATQTEPTELPAATAESIALAAGDQMLGELFDRLSAGAQAMLVRASVFRVPVAPDVLAARPAHIAECEAVGLLTDGPGHERSVHRWTAAELHRRLDEAGRNAEVAAAHRDAAGYWRARTESANAQRAQLELGYHLRRATELAADPAVPTTRRRHEASPEHARVDWPRVDRPRVDWHSLRRIGLVCSAGVIGAVLAVEATNGFSAPHLTSSDRTSHPAPAAPLSLAAAARDQAASWVASQVNSAAIVSCDPAMCSALVRSGVPAANLLVLGPGASDPLGSAVVVATAAVRAMFGSRLASVYAPETLASFGTGPARIDVRVVAQAGAFRAALAADRSARQTAGRQLLADPRVTATPSARAELASGQVDARLLITLAALAANQPVHIAGFADGGPGTPGSALTPPLRSAELAAAGAQARNILAFVGAQRPPFLPAHAGPSGPALLTVQFAAPSPLGLLQTQP